MAGDLLNYASGDRRRQQRLTPGHHPDRLADARRRVPPRPLVQQRGIDEYPVWSSNGTRLAFGCTLGSVLASRVGDFEICVVDADGTGLHRITDSQGISTAGGWSPDGTRILFASSREPDSGGVSSCGDLFVINAGSFQLVKLTDGPARDCGPSFTPDGRHILFSCDRAHPGGDSDLYVMNPDGSAITRLTHADSEEQEPTMVPCRGACQLRRNLRAGEPVKGEALQ
jgi:TolB protein